MNWGEEFARLEAGTRARVLEVIRDRGLLEEAIVETIALAPKGKEAKDLALLVWLMCEVQRRAGKEIVVAEPGWEQWRQGRGI
jgi:hypothetical protein